MVKIDLKKALAAGAHLSGIFFVAKFAGLFCSLYVTRSLTPEVFTILSIASVINGLTDRLTQMNLYAYLVRVDNPVPRQYEVAFSYEALRGVLLWGFILIAGMLIRQFGGDVRVGNAIIILSITFLINGFRSARLLDLRRNGQFIKYGICEFMPIFSYGIVSVILVSWQLGYLALVWTSVITSLLTVLIGYIMAPWKPRFSFSWKVAKPLVSLGIIISLTGFLGFARDQMPVFLLSWYGQENDVGYFNRATTYSWILGTQLVGMLWRVLLPMFSQRYHAGESSIELIQKLCRWIAILGIFGTVIVWLFSDEIIYYSLGEKWTSISPLWALLCVSVAIMFLSSPAEIELQATGHERKTLKIHIITFSFHSLVMWGLVAQHGLLGVGYAFLISQVLQLVLTIGALRKYRVARK